MTTEQQGIKEEVRKYYASRAGRAEEKPDACCGSDDPVATSGINSNLYTTDELKNLPQEAVVASLGCGNPVAVAELKEGEVVLDLGSGGGIDVLLSARRVGPKGKAYGLDMTDEMLDLARKHAANAGVTNVEFLRGEIENIPLPGNSVDVIISNCVVNLSPDKDAVLREAHRVLKPGGRFAVADIVTRGEMPAELQRRLELWAGCIAGALEENDYKSKLTAAGFESVEVETIREYTAADASSEGLSELMGKYAKEGEDGLGFISAIVRARKPVLSQVEGAGGKSAADEPVEVVAQSGNACSPDDKCC